MNVPTEILIDTEPGENATSSRLANNNCGASKKKALIAFPVLIPSPRQAPEHILKEKGTISVQNMVRAVQAARA